MALNRHKERVGENSTAPSLLAGMIQDEEGAPLTSSHAIKKAKRYRYYVSRPLQQGATTQGIRVPAGDIEHIVMSRLRLFFSNRLELHNAIEPFVPDASEQQALFEKADTILGGWDTRSVQEMRHVLLHLNTKVAINLKTVEISINPAQVGSLLEQYPNIKQVSERRPKADQALNFSVPATLKRAGMAIKLHVEGEPTSPDLSLIRLLVKASLYHQALTQDSRLTIKKLAEKDGIVSSYITRILRLHFLAPDIKRTILQGLQPPELSASQIAHNSRFPLLWEDQWQDLGFPAQHPR